MNTCESEATRACVSVRTGWWEMGAAGRNLNLTLVACRDTLSWGKGGCADPDHRQKGKLGVSKRRPESTREQSAPPGKQGKRSGRVQGGQHAPPPPGDSRY